MLKAKITPVVTLFHWDLPTALMDLGGWSNPKMVDYFEDYARVVFRLFGDLIKTWTTMNELHVHCYNVSFFFIEIYTAISFKGTRIVNYFPRPVNLTVMRHRFSAALGIFPGRLVNDAPYVSYFISFL